VQIPVQHLYRKYGNPHRVVEFRIFSFNKCGAGCKNCFYQKTNNDFYDFKSAHQLAVELKKNEYCLETLYLLPTDVFENEFNYEVFNRGDFKALATQFNYIGLATALSKKPDYHFLHSFFDKYPHQGIEMHVNLKENLLFDKMYLAYLDSEVRQLKHTFKDKMILNLALNLGSSLEMSELEQIQRLVYDLSDDKILELNFTFMFNENIKLSEQSKMLQDSYPVLQYFSKAFSEVEQAYNERTLLRKPSFVFKNNSVYLTPIVPFDEYVFLNSDKYKLSDPSFESFLNVYSQSESQNLPIINDCESCDMFKLCYGKQFFSLAHEMKLSCVKQKIGS